MAVGMVTMAWCRLVPRCPACTSTMSGSVGSHQSLSAHAEGPRPPVRREALMSLTISRKKWWS